MTVAALLFSKTVPVAITDSLISAPTEGGGPILTPLTDNEFREGDDKYVPVGIARKMWITENKIVFLYAGTVIHAKKLFDHLKTKTQYNEYTENTHTEMKDYVEAYMLNH